MADPLEPLPYAQPAGRVSGFAVASMTLGILAIPLDLALFVGIVPGIAAIVCGIVALRNIRRHPHLTGKSAAQAGIILGLLSLLLAIGCGFLFFSGNNF